MIRDMKYRDIEDVNTLLQDSFEEEYAHMNIDTVHRLKYMKRGYILEKVVSSLVKNYDKSLDFYVYEEDDKVRGCLRIVRYSQDVVYFSTIAIDRQSRKKGIGYSLMLYGEDVCRKRGAKYIIAVVKEENVPSLNLTRKIGYTIYDENYMYILEDVLPYKNIHVTGFRKMKEKDYEKIRELEEKVLSKDVLEIEGTSVSHTFLSKITNMLRRIFFGEKFYEYVLEKGDKITAYAKISHFLDGSSSIVVVSCEKHRLLKDFTEKILYYHAATKMRTIISKDQVREEKVLTEVGFKKYSHLHAICRDMRSSHG